MLKGTHVYSHKKKSNKKLPEMHWYLEVRNGTRGSQLEKAEEQLTSAEEAAEAQELLHQVLPGTGAEVRLQSWSH